jgi:hypothetical protein
VKNKTIVGHSLVNDFEILKINTKEAKCVVRDISNMELFMQTIDRDSHSPVPKDISEELQQNSSGSKSSQGSKPPIRVSVRKRKLKDLAKEFLNADIQDGHHSSVIDARSALALYRMHYQDIETKFRIQEAEK